MTASETILSLFPPSRPQSRAGLVLCLCLPLFLLAACAPKKDFKTLTLGEQIDFSTCVFKTTGRTPPAPDADKSKTPGQELDYILGSGARLKAETRTATLSCAKKMNIAPETIPGMQDQ